MWCSLSISEIFLHLYLICCLLHPCTYEYLYAYGLYDPRNASNFIHTIPSYHTCELSTHSRAEKERQISAYFYQMINSWNFLPYENIFWKSKKIFCSRHCCEAPPLGIQFGLSRWQLRTANRKQETDREQAKNRQNRTKKQCILLYSREDHRCLRLPPLETAVSVHKQ